MDNGAIFGGQFTVIAMAPDVIELRKIGTMVFAAIVVIPKPIGMLGKAVLQTNSLCRSVEVRPLHPKTRPPFPALGIDLASVQGASGNHQ